MATTKEEAIKEMIARKEAEKEDLNTEHTKPTKLKSKPRTGWSK